MKKIIVLASLFTVLMTGVGLAQTTPVVDVRRLSVEE
jgi:hypothetical protein